MVNNTYCQYSKTGVTQSISELFASPVIAFDAETTSLNNGKMIPVGFSAANRNDSGFYIHRDDRQSLLQMSDPSISHIAHNGKYDRSALKKLGITIDGIFDTLIAYHLLELPPPRNLKAVTKQIVGEDIVEFDELPKPVQALPFEEQGKYSCPHSYSTLAIWNKLYPLMIKQGVLKVFTQIEMPLLPVLSDMELNGTQVDVNKLDEIGKVLDENIETTHTALVAMSGEPNINFNSPDQIADLFYNKMKIKPPWQKTSSGRPTTEGKFLQLIVDKHPGRYPILQVYLQYKGFMKLKSTYVDGLKEEILGTRVYGNFNQDGTGTSRLSSSNPNLQNIPVRSELGKKIRTAWTAPKGCKIVKADASQLELRMIAHWSQDKRMLDAFLHNRDIHMETTMLIYNDPTRRPDGKIKNFQIVYGGGTDKDHELLSAAYPEVFAWEAKVGREALECGYARTLFGRTQTIPALLDEREYMQDHGVRQAISQDIQGSSAEVVKIMMRRVWDGMKDSDVKMTLQVHDELVFEVPDSIVDEFCQFLYKTMRYDELSLPFIVEVKVGDNWGEMKSVAERN